MLLGVCWSCQTAVIHYSDIHWSTCVFVGNDLLTSQHNNSIEVRAKSTRDPPRPPLCSGAGTYTPVFCLCALKSIHPFHLQWPGGLMEWKCTLYPKPFWSSKTVLFFIFHTLAEWPSMTSFISKWPRGSLGGGCNGGCADRSDTQYTVVAWRLARA